MANNKTAKVSANKTTKSTANKTTKSTANNNAAVNAIVQPDAVTQLTALVNRLMAEISELKAAKANSEITVPANKTTAKVPANKIDIAEELKTAAAELKTAANKKVNVVPANKFVLLAENEAINEVVTIASIGNPFWGKGFGGRSCMKQAVNCVTKSGNGIVVFLLLNRDAVGNTIPSGLVGGANYVLSGIAAGKTWEFNNEKTNIVNRARFSPVS